MSLRPRTTTSPWRFWRLSVVPLLSLLFGASVWSYTAPEEAPGADGKSLGATSHLPPGPTVVTFTFSDSTRDHTRIGALFGKYGMRATLQVISGRIGQRGYLSLEELRALADAGHEVGGHTLHHVNLSHLTPEEARREVCDDRAALMSLGFPVTSALLEGPAPPRLQLQQRPRHRWHQESLQLSDVPPLGDPPAHRPVPHPGRWHQVLLDTRGSAKPRPPDRAGRGRMDGALPARHLYARGSL